MRPLDKVKNIKGIKGWPKSERPRELILEKGPEFVSDAGLVAILLRSGIKGKDAVTLSRELLLHFDGLRGLLNASGLIFVHNHPSGDLKPSRDDLALNQKLVRACLAVDLTPLDHLIISSRGYISFKEKGLF